MIRRRFASRCSVVAVFVVSVLAAADAHADDPTKEQCIAANEEAQTLRKGGKLQAARTQLLMCVAHSCPGPVRDDCAERLNELDRATPSIVFTAKGAANADLTAVKVTMDGVVLTEHLDGTALNVEPGTHSFEFVSDGYPTVAKSFVIGEGSKGRLEVIAFAPSETTPFVGVGSAAGKNTGAGDVDGGPPAGQAAPSFKTWAYVAGGVGLAGVALGSYFGLVASSKWSSAKDACKIDQCGPSSDAQKERDDAASAGKLSTVAFIVGGAALVAGVTLFVISPSKAPGTARIRVVPGLGSLTATGEF